MILSTAVLVLVYMMTGPVATCAGSLGGAQPPPDPHRLPSQCESAPPATRGRGPPPRKGRGRGLAKGGHIAAYVATNEKIRLQFNQDGNTWKALGQHGAWYDSAVSIHTRDCCEPFHQAWKDVPAQQKAQMQERMLDWFDIERDQFQSVMDRDAKKCYKDWKNDFAQWFRGFDTVEEARASPHPTIRDASHWERCCDRFTSPEFQKVSDRNKANRKKQKFTSFHGRRSYAQHRMKKANTETQVPQPPIDNWRDMHLQEGTWANDLAEEAYNMMQQELQAQAGPSGSGSGSASVDQMDVMQRVLGRHRGRIPGVGPTLPQSSQQTAPGLSSAQQAIYEDRIQTLEATQQQLTDAVRQLTDVVQQLAPHIHLPSPDAPPSSSSAANDPDNDATNLGD